jgi:coiled-coil domain-containing protein 12
MASNPASLDAASADRKARLAKLASLKRKQPDSSQDSPAEPEAPSITTTFLSGRNYDPTTRGPKLGFEAAPTEGQVTLEEQAAAIALETSEKAKVEEAVDRPIDLFKLQPKKPNWDLKRDLNEKLKVLNVRTENAIARLVRERIEEAKKAAKEKAKQEDRVAEIQGDGDDEEVGIDGDTLVQGVHVREREEEEDERREREEEEDERRDREDDEELP